MLARSGPFHLLSVGQLHTSWCTREYISKLLAELDLMYNHEFALAQTVEASKHGAKTLKSVAAVEQSVHYIRSDTPSY